MTSRARDAPRILVLATVEFGVDTFRELRRRGIGVTALVGLSPDSPAREKASGWIDVKLLCAEHDVPTVYAETYSLSAEADRALLTSFDFDLVLVLGWQRLVPDWLIALASDGVWGVHGSPDGITAGRGRSPQNWALLLGCDRFELSLFRITSGIDDGAILATREFRYTSADDIRTSYYRVSLATVDMVSQQLLGDVSILQSPAAQSGPVAYFPQRVSGDGVVDWELSGRMIMDHCRALTDPYPGLSTTIANVSIALLAVMPFDADTEGVPGTVGPCFGSGDFLVTCGDGRVLVREWRADKQDWRPKPGMQLVGRPFRATLQAIVKRHRSTFPNRPLSRRLLAALRNQE